MLDRLKQYIDIKHISISAFEKSIGMSNASFGKSLKNGGTIGADKLEIILKTYPDINLIWLITGNGEMLNSIEEKNLIRPPNGEKCSNCEILEEKLAEKDKIIALQQSSLADKDEIIIMLKAKALIQDNNIETRKAS